MFRKYKNTKVEVDGHKFDSKKEAKRYEQLKALEAEGKISELILQPVFLLQESFCAAGKRERAIKYIADFQYYDYETDQYVVEDVKGMKTDVYKIKRKLFLYQYPQYVFKEV